MYKPLKVLTAIFVRFWHNHYSLDLMLRKPCAYQHTCTLYMVIFIEACPLSNRAPLQGLLMAATTVSWHGLYQRDVMRLET
jgi:hypothetical protein